MTHTGGRNTHGLFGSSGFQKSELNQRIRGWDALPRHRLKDTEEAAKGPKKKKKKKKAIMASCSHHLLQQHFSGEDEVINDIKRRKRDDLGRQGL